MRSLKYLLRKGLEVITKINSKDDKGTIILERLVVHQRGYHDASVVELVKALGRYQRKFDRLKKLRDDHLKSTSGFSGLCYSLFVNKKLIDSKESKSFMGLMVILSDIVSSKAIKSEYFSNPNKETTLLYKTVRLHMQVMGYASKFYDIRSSRSPQGIIARLDQIAPGHDHRV